MFYGWAQSEGTVTTLGNSFSQWLMDVSEYNQIMPAGPPDASPRNFHSLYVASHMTKPSVRGPERVTWCQRDMPRSHVKRHPGRSHPGVTLEGTVVVIQPVQMTVALKC